MQIYVPTLDSLFFESVEDKTKVTQLIDFSEEDPVYTRLPLHTKL
jgi:hypothetical protein